MPVHKHIYIRYILYLSRTHTLPSESRRHIPSHALLNTRVNSSEIARKESQTASASASPLAKQLAQ